jgi:Polyketide cyclase / dehydrase and lipid transport
MQVEHRITVHVQPELIYRIYEDVGHWHQWDPDTKQATLDGPLRVGARGTLTPTKGRAVPMRVTQALRGRYLTVESKIPMLRMVFEHELHPCPSGTEVVHRVTLSGLLSRLVGPMLCKRLNAGLPLTLAKLQQLAEGERAAPAQRSSDT